MSPDGTKGAATAKMGYAGEPSLNGTIWYLRRRSPDDTPLYLIVWWSKEQLAAYERQEGRVHDPRL